MALSGCSNTYGTHPKQIDPNQLTLGQIKSTWNNLRVERYEHVVDPTEGDGTRCFTPCVAWTFVVGSIIMIAGSIIGGEIVHKAWGEGGWWMAVPLASAGLLGLAGGSLFLYMQCCLTLRDKKKDIRDGRKIEYRDNFNDGFPNLTCCVDPTTLCPEKQV
jgi:hypothetical protein